MHEHIDHIPQLEPLCGCRVIIPISDLPHGREEALDLDVKLLPKASRGTKKHKTSLNTVTSGLQEGVRKLSSLTGGPCKLHLKVRMLCWPLSSLKQDLPSTCCRCAAQQPLFQPENVPAGLNHCHVQR